jgi:hypothetical protein
MVTAPAQVASLFTTPLLTEVWAESATALPSVRTAILDRQRQTEGVQLSNVLGWQSDDHMPEWGGDAARRLLAHVQARCDAATRDLDGKRPRWISNMWANVSPPGASNQTHSHPGAYWSAVYYVEDGYGGSPDRALGGELVFLTRACRWFAPAPPICAGASPTGGTTARRSGSGRRRAGSSCSPPG